MHTYDIWMTCNGFAYKITNNIQDYKMWNNANKNVKATVSVQLSIWNHTGVSKKMLQGETPSSVMVYVVSQLFLLLEYLYVFSIVNTHRHCQRSLHTSLPKY